MIINLLYDTSVTGPNGPPADFQQDIQTVVDYISGHFTDNIAIDLHVGFGEVNGTPLNFGNVGQSFFFSRSYSFADYKSALISHQTTADDATAISSLPSSDPIPGTHDFWLADSLAASLGLLSVTPGSPIEGWVGFSNTVTFDYNQADGINTGQYDFIGAVAHEISEVLGRFMGAGGNIIGDATADYLPLDLFHYASPGTRSFTRGGYFSIDGGQTNLAEFNRLASGDAGDWGGSTTNDSFLAISNTGVVNEITPIDLRVMDILGYRFDAAPPNQVSFIFSTNPNKVFATTDVLNVDTTSAASLHVSQVGANVVLTDGLHTATLQNFMLEQFQDGNSGPSRPNNIVFSDGSKLIIGDNTTNAGPDGLGNNIVPGAPTGTTAFNDQVFGLAGDNSINGGDGSDLIYGNQGNDTIFFTASAKAGHDTVFGGQGNDFVDYSLAGSGLGQDQQIYGNLGDDNLLGGNGNNSIYGGQGNDGIAGFAGNNFLNGGLGLDTIIGGDGHDTIFGGDGNDLLAGDLGVNGSSDLIYGNQGDDGVGSGQTTNAGNDTVFGGQGNDFIIYDNVVAGNNELIYGNLGNDTIISGAGNDTIFGGQGDDSITGGLGQDFMSGNLGNDTFVENTTVGLADSGVTTATADHIADFVTGADKIQSFLQNTDVPGTSVNYQELSSTAVTTIETAASTYNAGALARNYTFIAGATDGYLVIDADNNHAADAVIVLNGKNSLDNFAFTDII